MDSSCGDPPTRLSRYVAQTGTALRPLTSARLAITSPEEYITVTDMLQVSTPTRSARPMPVEQGWYKKAAFHEVLVQAFFDSNDDGYGDPRGGSRVVIDLALNLLVNPGWGYGYQAVNAERHIDAPASSLHWTVR